MNDNDLIRRGDAMQCCTDQLHNTALLTSLPPQSSAAWDARNAIAALSAAPTFTTADLERAWGMGRDAALADVQELRDVPSDPPGNERAEVYNEACDNILRFAVALTPPTDLAQRVKE